MTCITVLHFIATYLLFAQLGEVAQQGDSVGIDDILSGKIAVIGKFGRALGTPMIRTIRVSNWKNGVELRVEDPDAANPNSVEYVDDGSTQDTVIVWNQVDSQLFSFQGQLVLFYEGCSPLGPPLGFYSFGEIPPKSSIYHMSPLAYVVLPNDKTIKTFRERPPGKSAPSSPKSISISEVQSAVLGRFKRPLGTLFTGRLTVTRTANEAASVNLSGESNNASFSLDEIELIIDGQRVPSVRNFFRERTELRRVTFYERLQWCGLPDELKEFNSMPSKTQPFGIAPILVLNVPANELSRVELEELAGVHPR